MVAITGTFYDSGGNPISSGGITVKLDAPIVDVSASPDALYTEIERDFQITNGVLPVYTGSTPGVSRGFDLIESASKNVTYTFNLYRNVSVEQFYFLDGRQYTGTYHVHTDTFYYTGTIHSDESIRLDRVLSTVKENIGFPFHAVVPNVSVMEFAQLIPTRISRDSLPTTIQQIAQILVNTPEYLALLTQAKWRGEYNSSELYYKFDEVFYAGSSWIYVAQIPTTGNTPTTGSAYWELRTQKGDAGGTGGNDTPYNATGWNGALWAPSANAVRDVIETLAKVSDLSNYALKNAPALVNPTRTTNPANNSNDLSIATTAWTRTNFATLDSPNFTGNLSVPLVAVTDISNKPASTQFVENYINSKRITVTPAFLARRNNSNQPLSNNTYNVITYDTELNDTNNAFNPATGIFTVPTGQDGFYEFSFVSIVSRTSGSAAFDVNSYIWDGSTYFILSALNGYNSNFLTTGGVIKLYLTAGMQLRSVVYISATTSTLVITQPPAGNMFNQFSVKRLLL